jgi:hypothetical protein
MNFKLGFNVDNNNKKVSALNNQDEVALLLVHS